ncbi:MAG: hypothetical protein FJW79_12550, partial [Actinobacteria bacterium]|nr:hypothetical protein [Actinomycetota bacterium]
MRRQVRAKVSLLFGIVMVAATIASCGGDAASQQPQETTAATQESTMPSGQATSPASTAVAPGNGGTAVAPVETPENGGAAAGDADVRRAWDAVEIDMSLAMKAEGAERIAALWALVPGNLPLPEQWFDLEMSSGIGFGWDDCHDGKHPS